METSDDKNVEEAAVDLESVADEDTDLVPSIVHNDAEIMEEAARSSSLEDAGSESGVLCCKKTKKKNVSWALCFKGGS